MDIQKTMTIHEAAAHWDDPRAEFLEKWGERFNVRLEEIHPNHLVRYRTERSQESPGCVVDVELRALAALLKHVGLAA